LVWYRAIQGLIASQDYLHSSQEQLIAKKEPALFSIILANITKRKMDAPSTMSDWSGVYTLYKPHNRARLQLRLPREHRNNDGGYSPDCFGGSGDLLRFLPLSDSINRSARSVAIFQNTCNHLYRPSLSPYNNLLLFQVFSR